MSKSIILKRVNQNQPNLHKANMMIYRTFMSKVMCERLVVFYIKHIVINFLIYNFPRFKLSFKTCTT